MRELTSEAEPRYLGMSVLVMGWSWAVCLAQSGLLDLVGVPRTPEGLELFPPHWQLVEGGPLPQPLAQEPVTNSYIGDCGGV